MINFYNILTDKKVSQSLYEMLFSKFMQNEEPPTYREYTGSLPVTITANGSDLIDWIIYGNTGGVGDRTANLFDTFDIIGQVPSTGNGALVTYNGSTTSFISIESGNVVVTKPENILIYLMLYTVDGDYIGYDIANAGATINGNNITGYENAKFARLRIDTTSPDVQIMLNAGSTALPYEPYGYKITILSNSEPTDIYIDTPLGLNETVSFADTGVHIPTNNGSTVISCDNTVQPEKMYIKYIGG